MIRIQRALISVSDKTGLVPFARGLHQMGIELISTGGTAKLLKHAKIPVRLVSEYTNYPELLGGRVKTLHPKIHAGILAIRGDTRHAQDVEQHRIEYIDLVVVNLYPFEEAVQASGVTLPEAVEQIDIGGVTLLRSAAKNFANVAAVCRAGQYASVMAALRANRGQLAEETMRRLAKEVFEATAHYDLVISQYLASREAPAAGGSLPETLAFELRKVQDLRYGENPHQAGALYRALGGAADGFAATKQLQGKELSLNNLMDLDAAWRLVNEFQEPCCAIIKHSTPCGVSLGKTLAEAYHRAYRGDVRAAFGGIVGCNRTIDAPAAEEIAASRFIECVVAPGCHRQAAQLLERKKKMRVVVLPSKRPDPNLLELRAVIGAYLVQQADRQPIQAAQWRAAGRERPAPGLMREAVFAWLVAKHARSNAIVVAKGGRTLGIGAGQVSRIEAAEQAIAKAGRQARGAVLASDGFFPQPDSVKAAARAGIALIIQPGGSIRDDAVIRAANRAGIAMLLTGVRHFRH